jgi:hypothetical protein
MKLNHFVPVLDPAHIFPVSLYPHLCYEEKNVVLMNRFAHDQLENRYCPLTGKRLTDIEYNLFFIRMLGETSFNTLAMWAKNPNNYKQEKSHEQ